MWEEVVLEKPRGALVRALGQSPLGHAMRQRGEPVAGNGLKRVNRTWSVGLAFGAGVDVAAEEAPRVLSLVPGRAHPHLRKEAKGDHFGPSAEAIAKSPAFRAVGHHL